MATIKTTAKRNPITGDPVNDSPFPGSTGSKREQRKNAANTLTNRQNRAINKGVDPATGKIQYKGIPTKGEMRREERQKIRSFKDSPTSAAPTKRGGSSGGGGGKKGEIVKNKSRRIKMDKSCKGPKEWMR